MQPISLYTKHNNSVRCILKGKTAQALSALSSGATRVTVYMELNSPLMPCFSSFEYFWCSWKQKLLKPCACCSLQSRHGAMLRQHRSVCRWGSLPFQNTMESGNLMPVTRNALESASITCKQIATLTLDPKVVLTARDDRPMSLKSFEKEWVRETRGRSSATTTHVRTQDRLIPRDWKRVQTQMSAQDCMC